MTKGREEVPAYHSVFVKVIKNCELLVSGPALAMESVPGLVCFRVKSSSSKVSP